MNYNPALTTKGVRERLAREQDPIVRRNLETVLRHQEAEIAADLEGIMATMVEEPHFHFHGIMDASGKIHSSEVKGSEAVRAMYRGAIASKAALYQEFDCHSVVADRYAVSYAGWLRTPMDGLGLIALGYDADPAAHYSNEGMHWTFWSFREDGLAYGEDIAFDAKAFEEILSRRVDGL